MSLIAVLGGLYGDEAKAKMVDVLAAQMDIVIRFQGGSNAGHTVIFNQQKFVMHLIPSGIFHSNQVCVLASAVVIDPHQLENEMQTLIDRAIDFKDRFFIDERASVVLPIHKILDEKYESMHGDKSIGTTKRGIGPCYADSVSRVGLRLSDLKNHELLEQKLRFLYRFHNEPISESEISELLEYLTNFIYRTSSYLINLPYQMNKWISENKKILFEGAQGTLLDVYFGTYPYVTSSHTIAGGISTSVGFSPKKLDQIIGVMKSYFTRVGSGPFPTELIDETGERIRKQGNEFGSTTGRPRRCGWFDIVAARYSVLINGFDCIALTLLDVLTGLKTLRICTGYKVNDTFVHEIPADTKVLEKIIPEYIDMPGWEENITQCKNWSSLPENAKKYVLKIEELLEIPITIVSVGPSREQTIFRNS